MTISNFLMSVAVCAVSIFGVSTSFASEVPGSSSAFPDGLTPNSGANFRTSSISFPPNQEDDDTRSAYSGVSAFSTRSTKYAPPQLTTDTTQVELMDYFLDANKEIERLNSKIVDSERKRSTYLNGLISLAVTVPGIEVRNSNRTTSSKVSDLMSQLVRKVNQTKDFTDALDRIKRAEALADAAEERSKEASTRAKTLEAQLAAERENAEKALAKANMEITVLSKDLAEANMKIAALSEELITVNSDLDAAFNFVNDDMVQTNPGIRTIDEGKGIPGATVVEWNDRYEAAAAIAIVQLYEIETKGRAELFCSESTERVQIALAAITAEKERAKAQTNRANEEEARADAQTNRANVAEARADAQTNRANVAEEKAKEQGRLADNASSQYFAAIDEQNKLESSLGEVRNEAESEKKRAEAANEKLLYEQTRTSEAQAQLARFKKITLSCVAVGAAAVAVAVMYPWGPDYSKIK